MFYLLMFQVDLGLMMMTKLKRVSMQLLFYFVVTMKFIGPSVEMAKGAECMPELQTVNIVSTDDPTILYIPQCTRIERCGGCCKHDLLSCQPTKIDNVPFKVCKTVEPSCDLTAKKLNLLMSC